jgi:hypothetical protein
MKRTGNIIRMTFIKTSTAVKLLPLKLLNRIGKRKNQD